MFALACVSNGMTHASVRRVRALIDPREQNAGQHNQAPKRCVIGRIPWNAGQS